jgi:hypothetical protein
MLCVSTRVILIIIFFRTKSSLSEKIKADATRIILLVLDYHFAHLSAEIINYRLEHSINVITLSPLKTKKTLSGL